MASKGHNAVKRHTDAVSNGLDLPIFPCRRTGLKHHFKPRKQPLRTCFGGFSCITLALSTPVVVRPRIAQEGNRRPRRHPASLIHPATDRRWPRTTHDGWHTGRTVGLFQRNQIQRPDPSRDRLARGQANCQIQRPDPSRRAASAAVKASFQAQKSTHSPISRGPQQANPHGRKYLVRSDPFDPTDPSRINDQRHLGVVDSFLASEDVAALILLPPR